MQEIFDMIYYEGDILKTCISALCVVLIFELVLSILCIIKSAYKSVVR